MAGGGVAVLAREGGWAPPGRRCDLGLPQGELATCLAWDADTRYLVAATNKVRSLRSEYILGFLNYTISFI